MSAAQVNSFVGKFIALWTSNKDVSLILSAKDGKAKATLDLDLGEFTDTNSARSSQDFKEEYSSIVSENSRQRRSKESRSKEKLKTSISSKVENAIIVSEVECINTIENEREVPVANDVKDKNEEVPLIIESTKHLKEVNSDDDVHDHSMDALESKADVLSDDFSRNGNLETECIKKGNIALNKPNCEDIDNKVEKNSFVIVHAQVELTNCQRQHLKEDDYRAFKGILLHKDHLRRNVTAID